MPKKPTTGQRVDEQLSAAEYEQLMHRMVNMQLMGAAAESGAKVDENGLEVLDLGEEEFNTQAEGAGRSGSGGDGGFSKTSKKAMNNFMGEADEGENENTENAHGNTENDNDGDGDG